MSLAASEDFLPQREMFTLHFEVIHLRPDPLLTLPVRYLIDSAVDQGLDSILHAK